MATLPKLNHYVLSDLHLGHKRIIEYCRPMFKTLEEHDQYIIDEINRTYGAQDYLWLLGDIAFTKPALEKLSQIKCTMALIGGNHDVFSAARYLTYFEQIRGCASTEYDYFGKVLFSHIPMHSDQKRWAYNIHGHNHMDSIPDKRYINTTCEHISFTPKRIGELLAHRHNTEAIKKAFAEKALNILQHGEILIDRKTGKHIFK